jgi:hypothetical protein
MPSYAWAGWICFESKMEVEAAKGVPYRRPILLRCTPAAEEKDYDVLYSIDGVH